LGKEYRSFSSSRIQKERQHYRWCILLPGIDHWSRGAYLVTVHTHRTISAPDQTESLCRNPIKPSVYSRSSLSLVLYLATVVLAKQKRPRHW
jgi:hypothetical protein